MPRILMVDDEPRILDGFRRNLASHYTLEIAPSGADGLDILRRSLRSDNPFAVVISDMMMPQMNGAEFLTEVRSVTPDAVLMILSGQADLRSTVAAVNNSNLFRFIAKPTSPQALREAIDDALRQYQLVIAERELLHQTLTGAVNVLTQVLYLANPYAFSRANLVSGLVEATARRLTLDRWELQTAANLSQIGLVAIPPAVVERVETAANPTPEELEMYATHPHVTRDLIVRIPRMELVASLIAQQNSDGDPSAPQTEEALCADILAVATKFVAGREAGETPPDTAHRITKTYKHRSDVVREVLAAAGALTAGGEIRELPVRDLSLGMIFMHDVYSHTGTILVRKDDKVTEAVKSRLHNFANSVGVTEPIRVLLRR